MAAREDLKMRLTRLRGQTARLGRTGLSGPAVLRTAEVGIHLMLAAVLAGAEVFGGFAPFGVAMVGASGTGLCGGAALLGAGFGYLTLLGFSDALSVRCHPDLRGGLCLLRHEALPEALDHARGGRPDERLHRLHLPVPGGLANSGRDLLP